MQEVKEPQQRLGFTEVQKLDWISIGRQVNVITALYVSLLTCGKRPRKGKQVTWQALPGETGVLGIPMSRGYY